MASARLIAELGALIDALDRRVPHIERAGEARIARDAALLRNQAITRIAELRRTGSDASSYDPHEMDAVMTDDGGPAQEP